MRVTINASDQELKVTVSKDKSGSEAKVGVRPSGSLYQYQATKN